MLIYSIFYLGLNASLGLFAQTNEVAENMQRIDARKYITHVYTPPGFDNNDNAQFVVEGRFPNGCFSLGRLTVRMDDETMQHNLILFHIDAYEKTGDACRDEQKKSQADFMEVGKVGVLPEGEFKIASIMDPSHRYATLKIKEATTSETDNFIYAPVESVELLSDPLGFRHTLRLSGHFNSPCMTLENQNIVVHYSKDQNVLEVLPVATIKDEICAEVIVPFIRMIELPEEQGIKSGKMLLHARSYNGGAANKIDWVKLP